MNWNIRSFLQQKLGSIDSFVTVKILLTLAAIVGMILFALTLNMIYFLPFIIFIAFILVEDVD